MPHTFRGSRHLTVQVGSIVAQWLLHLGATLTGDRASQGEGLLFQFTVIAAFELLLSSLLGLLDFVEKKKRKKRA